MRALLIALVACTPPVHRATCGPAFAAMSEASHSAAPDPEAIAWRLRMFKEPEVPSSFDKVDWRALRPHAEEQVGSVQVAGVAPPLQATLEHALETRPGQLFREAPLQDDIRRLWAFGVIDDARIEVAGRDVTFVVTPREAVSRVELAGPGDVLRRFRYLPGLAYEPSRIARIAQAIERGLVRTGHLDADVRASQLREPGGVAVCVAANPGPRVTIGSIHFPGARAVPEATLRGVLHGGDKVNRRGGIYDQAQLEADGAWLTNEYYERGYMDVKLGTPRTTRHGDRIDVAVPVTEGKRYRIGTITLPPELALPIAIRPGDLFVRSKITAVTDRLMSWSYANAYPTTTIHGDRIDLVFEIHRSQPWYVLKDFALRLSQR